MKPTKQPHLISTFFLLTLSLFLSSCRPATLPSDAQATPTIFATQTMAVLGGGDSQPILVTPTPDLAGNPIQISEMQHFQQGAHLTVVVKLINTLESKTIRDVQLEIVALDATGTRIAQANDELKFIFPGETTGLVRQFDLPADIYTDRTEVRISGGYIDQNSTHAQPFSFEHPTFFGGLDVPIMTGWLNNQHAATYTEVTLSAIAYNGRGEIVGGGSSSVEFVPADDRIGVSIPSSFIGQPEKVELYAWLGPHSAALESGSWWNALKVKQWDFVVSPSNQVAGGAEWLNTTGQMLRKSWYVLTVYDDHGEVNLVQKGFIDTIWPNETLHFSTPLIYAPSDSVPTHADLLVVPGEFGQLQLAYDPLRASQPVVEFPDNQPMGKVTIINNLNARISDAQVMFTITNRSGKIVGSGFTFTGPLNGSSSTIVNVPVYIQPPYDGLTINASVIIPDRVIIGE